MPTPARLRPPSAQPSLTSPAVAAPLLTMQGEGTHRPYVMSRLWAFRDPHGRWFGCDHINTGAPGRLLFLWSTSAGHNASLAAREARRS